MTLVERASEWPKQWLWEGRELSTREVVEQGLAHERTVLRRMVASRFGEDIVERLPEASAGIADPERLAEVGEWLVRCDTGDNSSPVWPRRGAGRIGMTPEGS